MMGLSRNETAIAVRELVLSLVGLEIEVSVYVDRVLPRENRAAGPLRLMGPGGARVSVEMIGPDSADLTGKRPVIAAKGEAHAWCNEEILSAVRRAAERIMRAHPAWRRRPQ